MKRRESTKENSSSGNIIWPEYELDERLKVFRETKIPPNTIFIGLGYDPPETDDAKNKHYRRFYTKELEKVTELMPVPSPFECYNLKRGQSRGASKGLFSFGK